MSWSEIFWATVKWTTAVAAGLAAAAILGTQVYPHVAPYLPW